MVPVTSALEEGKLLAGQSSWIIKLQLQGQILSQKIRQIIQRGFPFHNPSHWSRPTWVWQNGSHRDGWQEEKELFCHWRDGDRRLQHRHSQAHPWSGLQSCSPREVKESWKLATKGMGTPDVCIDTSLKKAIWGKGIGNVENTKRKRVT